MNSLQNPNSAASLSDTGIYTDLTGLQKIKALNNQSEQGKGEALDAIAKQFESVFINMMMKSMREANEAFKDEDMNSSNEMGFYQQMFDQQLALSISSRGMGLADALKRQMQQAVEPAASVAVAPAADDPFKEYRSVMVQTPAQPAARLSKGDTRDEFTDQQSFIDQMMPLARKAAREIGVDARYLLSQAALETGWGKHLISDNQGRNSHNLFGIKAGSDWQGDVAVVDTLEYKEGIAAKERASFRSYDSYAESFADYAKFISRHDRYQGALSAAQDPEQYVHELQRAGYATDPEYANKIINIVSRNFTAVTEGDQG